MMSVRDAQRNSSFEKLSKVVVKFLMTFEDLLEEADQLGSRGLLGLGGGTSLRISTSAERYRLPVAISRRRRTRFRPKSRMLKRPSARRSC